MSRSSLWIRHRRGTPISTAAPQRNSSSIRAACSAREPSVGPSRESAHWPIPWLIPFTSWNNTHENWCFCVGSLAHSIRGDLAGHPRARARERSIHARRNRPRSGTPDAECRETTPQGRQTTGGRGPVEYAVQELRCHALFVVDGNHTTKREEARAHNYVFSRREQGSRSGTDRCRQHDVHRDGLPQ